MDGTIYRGKRLFDAAPTFLKWLCSWNIGNTFLTNNTPLSKLDYLAKLCRYGIDAVIEQIFTPADSTIASLRNSLADVREIAVPGAPSLCGQFEDAGFALARDTPKAVAVGFDTTLSYNRFCKTAYWIQQGRPLLVTYPDPVCPTDEPTVLVDCGAVCACLTAATGKTPVVPGKPDPSMLRGLCAKLRLSPPEMAMVGDRVYTDMVMARRAGVVSVLVLSAEATAADADALAAPPNPVVGDVGVPGDRPGAARARQFESTG